jgi:hypothetical protein
LTSPGGIVDFRMTPSDAKAFHGTMGEANARCEPGSEEANERMKLLTDNPNRRV